MKPIFLALFAFAALLAAPASSFAVTEDISTFDIKVQFGQQTEDAVQLNYYRTPQGMVMAISTNKGNYLVMKFERTVPGYELAIDSHAKITSAITLIVPESAKLENRVATLNDREVCAVQVHSHFNGITSSFCQ